jgi:hypothetical protein
MARVESVVEPFRGNNITATYVALTPERLRGPAQKVCDRIKQLCGAQPATSGANVAVLRA